MSSQAAGSGDPRITLKSAPRTGIMAEPYFDLATPNHFWCRRRFEVLQKIAGERLRAARSIAEIGCGNGVLLRQIEDAYPDPATAGFDLHEIGLRKSMTNRARLYCYDIHDRAPEFHRAFDLVLMFDVLEHIENESTFLASARFHVADGGVIVLNVPALQWLYSPYDAVQGHQRRYSLGDVRRVAEKNGLRLKSASYWGGPLVPIAALRKLLLSLRSQRPDTYETGFDPGSPLVNRLLYASSRCELVPQRLAGTSVMAILEPRT